MCVLDDSKALGDTSLLLQIKVAVSADRDCIRAYQPQISSTNYNSLTVNVKTSEPDNLLFYLGSSTSVSMTCGSHAESLRPEDIFSIGTFLAKKKNKAFMKSLVLLIFC